MQKLCLVLFAIRKFLNRKKCYTFSPFSYILRHLDIWYYLINLMQNFIYTPHVYFETKIISMFIDVITYIIEHQKQTSKNSFKLKNLIYCLFLHYKALDSFNGNYNNQKMMRTIQSY